MAAGVRRGDRLGLLEVLGACAGKHDDGVKREQVAGLQSPDDGHRVPAYEPHARKLMVPPFPIDFAVGGGRSPQIHDLRPGSCIECNLK